MPAALAGERLDRIVALMLDVSRSEAAAVIDAGGAAVDGQHVRDRQAAVAAKARRSRSTLSLVPEASVPGPDPTIEFGVVHVDDTVIVVDKPAGLVVHPGAGNPDGTLVNGLLARFPDIVGVGEPHRPGIVHRLDGGSSGLLVVARTQDAADALIDQFASHTATRVYIALVWGHPDAPHGVIDAPIGRSHSDPLRMAVVADGRPSRTEYRVLQRFDSPADLALLECRLETGRTHQIRVHLGSINHPLVGDPCTASAARSCNSSGRSCTPPDSPSSTPAPAKQVEFKSELAPDLAARLAPSSPSPTR